MNTPRHRRAFDINDFMILLKMPDMNTFYQPNFSYKKSKLANQIF